MRIHHVRGRRVRINHMVGAIAPWGSGVVWWRHARDVHHGVGWTGWGRMLDSSTCGWERRRAWWWLGNAHGGIKERIHER